jgi:hypothetical protein
VLLGLAEVLLEDARELRVTCGIGGSAQLGKRLRLDRVRIGEVLRELLLDVHRHRSSSVGSQAPRPLLVGPETQEVT